MPNLFQKAFNNGWLADQAAAAMGLTLTITRGAQSTEDVPAVLGQVAFRVDAEEGRRVQVGDRDYLIRVENYVIGGTAVKPMLGDRYQETGGSIVWELVDPDNGEPAWRYSDAERTEYRLHVKKVSP